VIRGVCAYDRGSYPQAIEWIQEGVALGLGGNAELQRVAAARLAFALVKIGRFELSIEPLTLLARLSPDEPGLVEATGLSLLRLPCLPSEVPAERRDLVQKLGRAGSLHLGRRVDEAAKLYEQLVAEYPEEPRVRYAYGVFLLRSGDDKGLAELRRAVELDPDDVMTRLELAFELLLHGDNAEAKEHAMKAVARAPSLFAARNALGRALVELGELDAGIRELEEAVRLAPESAEAHFALARAYARAGRTEDAARERAAFSEIEEHRRAAPAGAPATSTTPP
jgi:Flp pilus assembly protein TadD